MDQWPQVPLPPAGVCYSFVLFRWVVVPFHFCHGFLLSYVRVYQFPAFYVVGVIIAGAGPFMCICVAESTPALIWLAFFLHLLLRVGRLGWWSFRAQHLECGTDARPCPWDLPADGGMGVVGLVCGRW